MKILFYGGCHAASLKQIFERWVPNVTKCNSLTNYQLIRTKQPVPYSDFEKYDVIIFNPIRNKEHYNTLYLEEYLSSKRIKYLKYPWIQWNGYFPNYSNISVGNWYQGWWPNNLKDLLGENSEFLSAGNALKLSDICEQRVLESFNETTLRLTKNEHDCDLQLANFILENYQDYRLFLTPNHPSSHIYKYLSSEIAKLLDLTIDPAFFEIDDELQAGSSLPVLPFVKKILGLKFPSGCFTNKFVFNSSSLSVNEYVSLLSHSPSVIKLISKNNTRIYPLENTGSQSFANANILDPAGFEKGSSIIARFECKLDKLYDIYYLYASNTSGSSNSILYPRHVKIYRNHWQKYNKKLTPELLGNENTKI